MKESKKYVIAFLFAMITLVLMSGLNEWTRWGIDLLVGWFPITAWFSTIRVINMNNGVKYEHASWGTIGFAFVVALLFSSLCSILLMPLVVNGFLIGLLYNLMTKPDVIEEESEKKDTDI